MTDELSGERLRGVNGKAATERRKRKDLLRAPLLGRMLSWRHARSTLQAVLVALAALIVLDGLFGPQLAPRNLAGVIPWIHWRAFVVCSLLLAGNLFCLSCPFMLPRRLAKAILPGNRIWPRPLRRKWLAVTLLVAFFWAYEAFDFWASPLLTAWLIMAYFVAAFVVDGLFRGATFCKHLCPIGQFHFVNSTMSPLEVSVRDTAVCGRCRTKDCIRGRASGGRIQNGCELWLFQERKKGNVDCTFCLECVHACPHDNVGVLSRQPASELWEDPWRSGIGRFGRRPDLAALVLVLTFAAFLNAFGMVSPLYRWLEWLAHLLGLRSEPLLVGMLFFVGLVLAPALLASAAASATRALSGSTDPLGSIATRFSYALVPLGFAMWMAHYLFHFLLGGLTLLPLTWTYLSDLGILATTPDAALGTGTLLPEEWILPLQVLILETGLLMSLVVGYRIARRGTEAARTAVRASLPWSALAVGLSLAGLWILAQPMEMRGTLMGG